MKIKPACVALLNAGLVTACLSTASVAQSYPVKPIRVVHSFQAGGITDLLARSVGQKMQDALGQNILVEPRPGGGGNIGAEVVAKSAPDGYVLYLGIDGTMAISPWLLPKPNFDPVKDFAPVSNLAFTCLMFIGSTKAPRKTLPDLVAFAKANPGKVTVGGSNALTRMMAEQLKRISGTDMLWVPYQGAQQTGQALFAGDIDMSVSASVPYAGYIKEGRMLGFATTSPKREPRVPDMPTVRELGYPQLEGCGWLAMFAPGGTPRPVVERLNGEIAKVLKSPEVTDKLAAAGLDAAHLAPDELAALLKSDLAKWGTIIKAVGITSQ
jgi:tripartite-type tricarboxylate transporter receptor subunit TctC